MIAIVAACACFSLVGAMLGYAYAEQRVRRDMHAVLSLLETPAGARMLIRTLRNFDRSDTILAIVDEIGNGHTTGEMQ